MTRRYPNCEDGKVLTGWSAMDRRIRDADERKVEDFKEDIDTLLVFAGLFSAVTTTFLVESYKLLQRDQAETTNILLAQIYSHLAGPSDAMPPVMDVSCIASSSCSFQPSPQAKRINNLWFSSLILSLATASFSMLVKQWIREYLSGDFAAGQARLRIRFFRYLGMLQWKVFDIAAVLPLLLQLALALFFAGLSIFAWSVDSSVGSTSVSLVSFWAALIIVVLFSPAFSPQCPYKITFLKDPMRRLRTLFSRFFSYGRAGFDGLDLPSTVAKVIVEQRKDSIPSFEEESFAVTQSSLVEDLDILMAIDCTLLDDELLATGIASLLTQSSLQEGTVDTNQTVDPLQEQVIPFVLKIIESRIQNKRGLNLKWRLMLHGQLSLRAWTAIVEIVSHFVQGNLRHKSQIATKGKSDIWIANAITILISLSEHPLPEIGRKTLARCLEIDSNTSAHIICDRTPVPVWAVFLPRWITPGKHALRYYTISQKAKDRDVFTDLLDAELRGVLSHLHQDALLSAIYHLLHHRYCCVIPATSNFCSHKNLFEFLNAHPVGSPMEIRHNDGTRYMVSLTESSFHRIVDMLLNELDDAFQSTPPDTLPGWVLEASRVIFGRSRFWNEDHKKRIARWLCNRTSLLWYLQLAAPVYEQAIDISHTVVLQTNDIYVSALTSSVDRKEMLKYISEILQADCSADTLSDSTMLKVNHFKLGHLLLNMLVWHSQSPPDSVPFKQRALVNAWNTTLKRLAAAIRATTSPSDEGSLEASQLIADVLQFSHVEEMAESLAELTSALDGKILGSAVAGVQALRTRYRHSRKQKVESNRAAENLIDAHLAVDKNPMPGYLPLEEAASYSRECLAM